MRLLPILLALAVFVACSSSSSDDDETPTPAPSRTASPSPQKSPSETPTADPVADFPETTPFSAELTQKLHQVRDRVAAIRGLPLHEGVKEGLLSTEALAQYGRDQFAALEPEDAQSVEESEAVLALLGLVPPGYSFEDYVTEEANLIAGLYYPEADHLVIVGSGEPADLTIQQELTLAHEYVHALQDARYDLTSLGETWLEAPEEEDGYTSYGETVHCLVEGDAEFAQTLYAEEVFGPDWRAQLAAEYAAGPPIEFDIPEFLLRAIFFNYSECLSFVETLYEDGGWEAVDAAYADPPGTTEQVLQIEKYYAGEVAGQAKPSAIDGQVPGWTETFGGQWGMFDTYNYVLSRSGDFFAADESADGWDHGWLRTFRADGSELQIAIDVRIGFETMADRQEFLEAFAGVLGSHGLALGEVALDDGVRRWETPDEFGQFGALSLAGELGVRLVFGQDAATIDAFVAAD
ncbi:MAG TPA: hypothetical protein VMR52_06865 [Dehalococcoidia bacterium]|nr:hypothetical protein [Dehalococcoidia bacterium]